jgi:hypothetical protein
MPYLNTSQGLLKRTNERRFIAVMYLAILFLFSLLAINQGGTQPRQQQPPGHAGDKTNSEIRPLPPSPAPPTLPPPSANTSDRAITAPNTNQNQNNSRHPDEQSKHWYDFIDPFSTLIIAIFTGLTFVVVRNQLNATKIEKRAWIVSQVMSVGKADAKGTYQVLCRTMNNGQTPAWMMAAGSVAIVKNKGEQLPSTLPNYAFMSPFPLDGQLLTPNGFMDQGFPISEVLVAKILKEEKLLYVAGVIEYRDVYKETHHTRYCYQIKRNNDLTGPILDGFFEGPIGYNEAT